MASVVVDCSRFQKYLQSLVTTKDIAKLLSRSEMTIHNWRKYGGLPYYTVPQGGPYRNRDLYLHDVTLVKAWAQTNGKTISSSSLAA